MSSLSPFQQKMAQRDLAAAKAVEEANPATGQPIDEFNPMVAKRRELLKIQPQLYEQMRVRGKISPEELEADAKWAAVHWTPELQERYRQKKAKFAANAEPVHTGRSLMAEAAEE